MERKSPGYRLVEANSTGGQGSWRAVQPSGGVWIRPADGFGIILKEAVI
jgi:hypothetical protein